ncbi:hypothetical protein [Celeribacter neptunius]|uniref:Uncharacterized protein n=1 Tax=Celeribacter neptunius TaxID=588602 RepID=A0A1I3IPT0_9RHOB|nr:hypothetical protein [Celeribacter neptunius]SFI49971.1 hypothetical protein SAMN04487991_0094 [Celeribacter neptunius]
MSRFGVGHNGGPSMDGGVSFRRFAWQQARKGLLGERLPVEVIRRRVRRAEELGLPYRSYASIRAATGRDVLGFLFSTNALRLIRQGDRLPVQYADKLARLKAARLAAVHAPLDPGAIAALDEIDRAGDAPRAFADWSVQRAGLKEILGDKLPRDAVVLISEAAFEAEWCASGKLAGAIPAPVFFGD